MSDRLLAALAELVEALREEVRTEAEANPRTPDRLLSVNEAAERMGVGRSFLYGEIRSGRLRSIQLGRRRLIAESALGDRVS